MLNSRIAHSVGGQKKSKGTNPQHDLSVAVPEVEGRGLPNRFFCKVNLLTLRGGWARGVGRGAFCPEDGGRRRTG